MRTAPPWPSVPSALAAIRRRPVPSGASGFAARVASLELLDVHVFDRLHRAAEDGELSPELSAVRVLAEAFAARLRVANERSLGGLRARIRSGRSSGAALRRALLLRCGERDRPGTPGSPGAYDALDVLVSDLLTPETPARERAVREPEMVAYQPTPARAVLALIERAELRPSDVFYDLGSGLGVVVTLVALLTGCRARGIEIEPAYVTYARRRARSSKVRRATFVLGDARRTSLASGTVYFLYTPFRGAILEQVFARIERESTKRKVRVCTYGPCTMEAARLGWLVPRARVPVAENDVAVFESVGPSQRLASRPALPLY